MKSILNHQYQVVYLWNFIMWAVTGWANLIIWSFLQLRFYLKTPDRSHPRIFLPIHKTNGYIIHLTPTLINKLEFLSLEGNLRILLIIHQTQCVLLRNLPR